MLTYELKKRPGAPLYESLYRAIRADILSGKLKPDSKLPSKRALSDHLEVSKITVEGAYNRLLSEGFIRSVEKVGYFVEAIAPREVSRSTALPPREQQDQHIDLTGGSPVGFPFSVWNRLQREVIRDLDERLLLPVPPQGLWELRKAIADHLAQFRGMEVDPGCIVVGAGTDFLYNLLIQLLGQEKRYALEDPGYGKIRRIYAAAGAVCTSAPMDESGVRPQMLDQAQVLHLSASHHFPTGIITPMHRRQELLQWVGAQDDRWIIEDDYDSEFRFDARPVRSMQTMAPDRVIYINTFSKSLAPSIRIGYMILPPCLIRQLHDRLGFYSCTVSSFEQHTLARFISRGCFETHINRMRKRYKLIRNRVLELMRRLPVTVLEENAGLHFIVKVQTALSDRELTEKLKKQGLRVRMLSSYYHGAVPEKDRSCIVVSYAGLTDLDLQSLEEKLGTLNI